MNFPLLITLAVLGGAIVLLLTERVRPDVVALLVVVALGMTGVLTSQETFSGFSRSAVITIIAIFMLAAGLERTGVTRRIGDLLVRAAGTGETRQLVVVMLAAALLSLFMNNIAAAAVLLPAVSGAARRGGANPARLMMPLAFGTILGGMATLLTTTNIVVSSLLRSEGLAGYDLLDFAPLGFPLLAAGVAYMALWGRRQLPARSPAEMLAEIEREEEDLADIYHLGEALVRAGVPAGSPLTGRTLAAARLRERYGLNVVAIERAGRLLRAPVADSVIEGEDVLLLSGEPASLDPGELEVLPPRRWRERDLESRSVAVVEAILSPRSTLTGRTLRQTLFRERFGMSVIALWRSGRPLRTGLTDLPLQLGDGLLLQGPREHLPVLRSEPDLIVLDKPADEPLPASRRGPLALAILVATLAVAASRRVAIGEAMLGGALVMVLAGVLDMDQAYRSVEWRSVFLVAGMLPLSTALAKTGAAALATDAFLGLAGGAGPRLLLAALVAVTIALTQVMNGAAVAAIVAPVAIQTAERTGLDPRSLAMGVALATSIAFLTPLGHPVNVLVMGPGGYRFRDYFRVGLPLTLILFALIVVLLPVFWRLKP